MNHAPDKLVNCETCLRLFFPAELSRFEILPTMPKLMCANCIGMHQMLKPVVVEGPEDDPEFWDWRGDK